MKDLKNRLAQKLIVCDQLKTLIQIIEDSVDFLRDILASKTQQDVIETIKVLTQLNRLGIKSASEGVRRMLTLVFSKDPKIKDAVVESYQALYFQDNEFQKA